MYKINIIICLIFNLNFATSSLLSNIINGTSNLLNQAINQYNSEPPDTIFVKEEYDFIVVGAGTAGCVVAARLAENPNWNVLLIEAGGRENFYADVPGIAIYLTYTSMDWGYKTIASPDGKYCASAKDGRCNYGRGKVLGGSSSTNFQFYTRGHRSNFDEWARLGNDGWSFDDILPYFKKVENFNVPGNVNMSYHGTDGPVYIGYETLSKEGHIFIDASKQYGLEYIDYNGGQQIGVSRIQSNIKNGIRQSASRTYLNPIRNRKNLDIKKLSMVKRILINPETKETYGVEYVNAGQTYQVKARKEVIVSGGAINSPQILMLSGIGPKDHLEEKNIEVIENLPVGQHSIDHILSSPLIYLTNQDAGLGSNLAAQLEYANNLTGPIATTVLMDSLTFVNVEDRNNTKISPNIEMIFCSNALQQGFNIMNALGFTRPVYEQLYSEIKNNNSFGLYLILLQPKSRGKILLQDNKYDTPPIIAPNYLDVEEDLETHVKGLKMAMEIIQQDAFKQLNATLWEKKLEACEQYSFHSDEYLGCSIRHLSTAMLHMVGTCRMGPDNDKFAVVDNRLRVKGVKNLRVIDASIMPHIPAAHTNAATFMIGEKGADLIREDYQQ